MELFCFELEASHWEVVQEELGKPDGKIKMLTLGSIEGVHEETIGPIARTAAAVPEVRFQVAFVGRDNNFQICSKWTDEDGKGSTYFLLAGAELSDLGALGCGGSGAETRRNKD